MLKIFEEEIIQKEPKSKSRERQQNNNNQQHALRYQEQLQLVNNKNKPGITIKLQEEDITQ